MTTIYLSLGSNLGDREANLRAAIERLPQAGVTVRRASAVYETEPRDIPDQPWFLNQVIEAETNWFPRQLLSQLQRIERELGRKRTVPKGPRVIDLDILLYGDQMMNQPNLVIPHPLMATRKFVLAPLAEIAPEVMHPVLHKTAEQLLRGLKDPSRVTKCRSDSKTR